VTVPLCLGVTVSLFLFQCFWCQHGTCLGYCPRGFPSSIIFPLLRMKKNFFSCLEKKQSKTKNKWQHLLFSCSFYSSTDYKYFILRLVTSFLKCLMLLTNFYGKFYVVEPFTIFGSFRKINYQKLTWFSKDAS
jgi:hypothetical protein